MVQPLLFPAAVPESVRRLIELFEKRSEELRFPGVDFARLAEAVHDIQADLAEQERAQAALTKAGEEVARRQRELLALSKQAHAYATIFAQGEPELLAELSAMSIGESERPARKSRQRSGSEDPAKSGGFIEPTTANPPEVAESAPAVDDAAE